MAGGFYRTGDNVIVILLTLIQLLDAVTTHIGLNMGAIETNPIINNFIDKFGIVLFYIGKLSLGIVSGLLLSKAKVLASILVIMYTYIIINNLVVITRLY
jgi:hypothetical protein